MARGNSKAQSELPSGFEASRNDIETMKREASRAKTLQEYSDNWTERTGFKSFGKVNAGDGEVGNGIIKDGVLHLRDEDIKDIVAANSQSEEVSESIRNGGASELEYFTPFTGKNNVAEGTGSYFGMSHELTTESVDLPDANDFEVEDFDGGSSRTWEDPGEDASGSISIGRSTVDARRLQIDYEKVSGMPVDRESMVRLSKALEKEYDSNCSSIEEDISSDYDWSEYAANHRSDYESERERDYD